MILFFEDDTEACINTGKMANYSLVTHYVKNNNNNLNVMISGLISNKR